MGADNAIEKQFPVEVVKLVLECARLERIREVTHFAGRPRRISPDVDVRRASNISGQVRDRQASFARHLGTVVIDEARIDEYDESRAGDGFSVTGDVETKHSPPMPDRR